MFSAPRYYFPQVLHYQPGRSHNLSYFNVGHLIQFPIVRGWFVPTMNPSRHKLTLLSLPCPLIVSAMECFVIFIFVFFPTYVPQPKPAPLQSISPSVEYDYHWQSQTVVSPFQLLPNQTNLYTQSKASTTNCRQAYWHPHLNFPHPINNQKKYNGLSTSAQGNSLRSMATEVNAYEGITCSILPPKAN